MPKYGERATSFHNYIFPLGLGYISSTLKQANYMVDCLNLNHEDGTTGKILGQTLARENYDILLTGGMCIHYHGIAAILRATRKHGPVPKIILGGLIVTGEPETIMLALEPDIGVIGEGERTIIELIECLNKNGDLNDVQGIIFKDPTGRLRTTQPRPVIEDINLIPRPDFEGFGFEDRLQYSRCNDNHAGSIFDFPRSYPLLGSRGCPFNCTFCWHPERHRVRLVDEILKELRTAAERFRVNYAAIYDDCFSTKKERLAEFCQGMETLRKETPWDIRWSCSLMVNIVDRNLLLMLKSAGCSLIAYGFESYSPKILKSMRKPIAPQQINKALCETRDAGITVTANFIFGDVAETPETVRETLEFWKTNARGQIDLGFIHPYPQSDIYRHCLKKGIITNKLDFLQNKISTSHYNHFNMTDAMSDRAITKLYSTLLDLSSQYMPYVRPKELVPFSPEANVYKMKLDCPFCKKENGYSNVRINNRLTYGFYVVCRYCAMRLVIVGLLQSLAKHQRIYRILRQIKHFYQEGLRRIKNRLTT